MSNIKTIMSQVSAANIPPLWLWNPDYVYYDPTAAGHLSTATYFNQISVSGTSASPTSLFISPDGSKMFILDSISDSVSLYNLSSSWKVNTASYSGTSFSVGSQEPSPSGIFFRPDGSKMYIVGYSSDSIHQYALSTPWDLTTASYDNVSFSVSSQDSTMQDLYFTEDGTKLYTVGSGSFSVYQYSLSTAWDLSTVSYIRSLNVSSRDSSPRGLTFLSDGTRMYFCGDSFDLTYEYILGTPWDISTASFVTQVSTTSGTRPEAIFLDSSGGRIFTVDSAADVVRQMTLGSYYFGNRETSPESVYFSSDGDKMYIMGTKGDDVNQFNLSTAWDLTTASYSTVYYVGSQTTNPYGLHFSTDGTKMFVSGSSSIFEYSLSTAWSISTASFTRSLSTTSVNGTPTDISFSRDGSVMFMLGTGGTRAVYKYELSTPWNISTATYTQAFSLTNEYTTAYGLFLRPDGEGFFVVGASPYLGAYSMSPNFDLISSSYIGSHDYTTEDAGMHGLYFRDGGDKLFLIGQQDDRVFEYSVGVA